MLRLVSHLSLVSDWDALLITANRNHPAKPSAIHNRACCDIENVHLGECRVCVDGKQCPETIHDVYQVKH